MGIAAGFFAKNDVAFVAVASIFTFAGLWLMCRAPSSHHTFDHAQKRAILTWRTISGSRRKISLDFDQIADVRVAKTPMYDEDKMYRAISTLFHASGGNGSGRCPGCLMNRRQTQAPQRWARLRVEAVTSYR
ncbi:MAG: hypothetical protein H0V16_10775 [Burkholderiaceae bacterium]|nr:hypothetical protein [Burkholderiaceae bacterium]